MFLRFIPRTRARQRPGIERHVRCEMYVLFVFVSIQGFYVCVSYIFIFFLSISLFISSRFRVCV